MGTSTSTSAPILPTVEEINGWDRDRVKEFLQERSADLELELEDIDKMYNQKVLKGSIFLELTREDLLSIDIPLGTTKEIVKLISNIKGELSKKRKALEEVRKTWKVSSTLRETDWSSHYFMDPVDREQQEQASLFKKITDRSFIMLYGTRASGKSTRVMRTISELESENNLCNYISFQHVNGGEDFWNSFGINLSIHKGSRRHLKSCTNINRADDFLLYFSLNGWEGAGNDPNDRIVLFFDEFDRIFEMDDNIRSHFLSTLRSIRNQIESYVIQAIVVVGTFSILHLDSTPTQSTSPFNIKDSIRNPNFNMEIVQELFQEFENDNEMQIEQKVIDDIFEQTNGHAGLVCLCGRAIEDNLLRKLDRRRLSYGIWECYKVRSLMDDVLEYQTFRNLVNYFKNPETKDVLNFFRNNFLVDFGHEVKVTTDTDKDNAECLASEGVLVPGEEAGAFKLSSPLVRWLILQRVIPMVFPSCPRNDIPFFKDSKALDTLITLKLAIKSFDKDLVSHACIRSYKIAKMRVNGERNQAVPRESVYDAELCRVLRNWLCPSMFQITGQWHLVNNRGSRRQHRYSDLVIDTPYNQKIVLELLATASNDELIEHFERALEYANLLSANETWIVHLTCEDEYVKQPLWPSDNQLKMNLNVAHIYHDLLFTKIDLIAGWWSTRKNKMSTYSHSAEI